MVRQDDYELYFNVTLRDNTTSLENNERHFFFYITAYAKGGATDTAAGYMTVPNRTDLIDFADVTSLEITEIVTEIELEAETDIILPAFVQEDPLTESETEIELEAETDVILPAFVQEDPLTELEIETQQVVEVFQRST